MVESADSYDSTRRLVVTFDINELIEGCYMFGKDDKQMFKFLKDMFRYRKVGFKDLTASYLFEQVFQYI